MAEKLEKDIQPTSRTFLHAKVWNDTFKVYDIVCVDQYCEHVNKYHCHTEKEQSFA